MGELLLSHHDRTHTKFPIGPVGAKTAFIEPGSPWENRYVESFNGKPRDELLTMEVFNTLAEARILIEQWRQHDNTVRPQSSPRYQPPAPEVVPTSTPPSPAGPPSSSSGQAAAMLHEKSAWTPSWGLVTYRITISIKIVGTSRSGH
jgi:hypothetical protein